MPIDLLHSDATEGPMGGRSHSEATASAVVGPGSIRGAWGRGACIVRARAAAAGPWAVLGALGVMALGRGGGY